MKKVLIQIIKSRTIIPFVMFCAIHTYNFCYRLISVLAIHREGGLHPKHRIMNYHEFFVDNTPVNARVLDL